LLEGFNLGLSRGRDGTAGCARIVWVVLTVQFREIAPDARGDLLEACGELGRGEVALFGVDRFDLAAVDSDEFTRQEVELFAQHRELPATLAQRLQGVLPEVRNRLVIWSQLLEAPHPRHLPVRRLFQATTRPETVEIAINRELQQIRWMVGRPSRGCGCGSLQAERREVEVVDKGVEETDGYCWSSSRRRREALPRYAFLFYIQQK
jgi:hypothetical protein